VRELQVLYSVRVIEYEGGDRQIEIAAAGVTIIQGLLYPEDGAGWLKSPVGQHVVNWVDRVIAKWNRR
jgi:hypothetical protein